MIAFSIANPRLLTNLSNPYLGSPTWYYMKCAKGIDWRVLNYEGAHLNVACKRYMSMEDNRFEVLDNNFVIGWIIRTILAITVGTATGFAIAQLFFCTHSVSLELVGSVLIGSIVGTFVGIAQSSLIGKVVSKPKLWTIASIVGWTIAMFLIEVNWPFSRCLTSSNAASYTPGPLIRTLHYPINLIAEQMERIVAGEILYRGIYISLMFLLMGSSMGLILGLPQGIGQWLVLRRDLPRSSIMIWMNVIAWSVTVFFTYLEIELVDFEIFWALVLVPVVLILPAAVTAWTLVRLKNKPGRDRI